jgi:hypothetical protein
MSIPDTDLVIQLSAETPDLNEAGVVPDEQPLVAELRRCLRPGVEIALVFQGYMATTSILWLSGPSPDHGLRAGIRLLGVSALPEQDAKAPVAHDRARLQLLAHR